MLSQKLPLFTTTSNKLNAVELSYKPLGMLETGCCKNKHINVSLLAKDGDKQFVWTHGCLTNTTDNLFTLLGGACPECNTAEASRLRGVWGVSVNRANHMLSYHVGPANDNSGGLIASLHVIGREWPKLSVWGESLVTTDQNASWGKKVRWICIKLNRKK